MATDTRRIAQMKNLGPACEVDLNAAGIMTAGQLITEGAEGAFLKLLESRVSQGKPTHGCNAMYLYALYGAIHDIGATEVPEQEKVRFKAFTAELRQAGAFS